MRCCVPLRTSWDSHTFDLCLRWHILLVPSQISPRLDLLLHFVFDGSGAKLQLNATGGHDCCSETVTIWIVGNEGVHQLLKASASTFSWAFRLNSWGCFLLLILVPFHPSMVQPTGRIQILRSSWACTAFSTCCAHPIH